MSASVLGAGSADTNARQTCPLGGSRLMRELDTHMKRRARAIHCAPRPLAHLTPRNMS